MILTNKLAFSTLNPLLWENIIPSQYAPYMMKWHQPFGVGDPLRVQAKIQPTDTDSYTLHIRRAGDGRFGHTLDGETVATVPFISNVLSEGHVFIDAYYDISLDYGCYYAEVRDSLDRPLAYSHFFQVIEDLSNTFEWRITQERNLNLLSFQRLYVQNLDLYIPNTDMWDVSFNYYGTILTPRATGVSLHGYDSDGANVFQIRLDSASDLDLAKVYAVNPNTGETIFEFDYDSYNDIDDYVSYEYWEVDGLKSQYIKIIVLTNEEDPFGYDSWESEVLWFDTTSSLLYTFEGIFLSTDYTDDFFIRLYGGFREDEVNTNIKGGVFEQQDLLPYEMHAKAYENEKLTIDQIPNWMVTKVVQWTTIREKTIDDSEMSWTGEDIEVVDKDSLNRGFQILKITFSDKFGIDEQKSSYGAYICDENYTPIETTQGTLIL